MTLIHCAECGEEISNKAKNCPHCGAPPETYSSAGKTQGDPDNGKKIKETQATCNECGNQWYFGKEEVLENTGKAISNCGKSMMCCSGCIPAAFFIDDDIEDLEKCPDCGSKNVKTKEVTHDVK